VKTRPILFNYEVGNMSNINAVNYHIKKLEEKNEELREENRQLNKELNKEIAKKTDAYLEVDLQKADFIKKLEEIEDLIIKEMNISALHRVTRLIKSLKEDKNGKRD